MTNVKRGEGWIPEAVGIQMPSGLSSSQELLKNAVPWDFIDKPAVSTWQSYQSFLVGETFQNFRDGKFPKWHEVENVSRFFTSSQGYRPNCAGFAMANATTVAILTQMVSGSEQKPTKFNPFVTWLISKNGSTLGGQTISAIALAGNEYGNYPTELVGDYNPSDRSCYQLREEHATEAQKYQIGVSLFEGSRKDLVDYIILQLENLHLPVILGNGYSVTDGGKADDNGVPVVTVSGTWSHATVAVDSFTINEKRYIVVMNSHGEIYRGYKTIPKFCFILTEDDFRRYMSSDYTDAAFVTYSEAPYDKSIEPTLNPNI